LPRRRFWLIVAKSILVSQLSGKWALVTGASRGIGRVMALALADAGVNVVVQSRSLAGTASLVDEIKQRGVDCFAVACDLVDPAQVRQMANDVISKVDLAAVYNNAGVQPPSQNPYWNADSQQYLDTYAVNMVAPAIIIETVLPAMLSRGFGRIVNTTSGIANQPEQSAYAASKGALNKYTKDFAATLAGSGVTMNVLDPGWIQTDLGGPNAPNSVDTVIPGAIVGGFTDDAVTGQWLNAQDFTGMSLADAIVAAPEKALTLAVTA